MSKRIWELDALRGIFILLMVVIHLVYDITELVPLVELSAPWLDMILHRWGLVFLILSGVCVTLGSHPVKRGALVFGCGMLCTAATMALYLLDVAGRDIIIWFGVLHCLGVCMMLWPLLRKIPNRALWWVSAGLILLGLYLANQARVDFVWLMPLGLPFRGFSSSDYFPLLPNLGYFLLGAAFGRAVYAQKQTRLPNIDPDKPVIRFLTACGRHSLWIYLLHQPVLLAGVFAFARFSA